jgi:hypothetical protein
MISASLSVFDPTVIGSIRDQLADDYAKRIYDAVPDVSECVEFEAETCDSSAEKERFERASQMLSFCRGDLQLQTAAAVRRIFDESLIRQLDGGDRGARCSLESMTLLADERLDEEIAVNHCARRLKEQSEFELWGLTQRIGALTDTKIAVDSQNPVYPKTFATALMEAIGSLENNAHIRLVLFKAFGPVLLEILPALYTATNNVLSARGIDIEHREYDGSSLLARESASGQLPTAQEIALGAATANLAWTSTLNRILAQTTSALPIHAEAHESDGGGKRAASRLPAPDSEPHAAPEPDWFAEFGDVQPHHPRPPIEQTVSSPAPQGACQALPDKLTPDEQVVSDIITIMFDHLRADARMPPALHDIVMRLQLPVRELALRDRSLLTQVHHPVRKLIDLIAEFGLNLRPGDDDDSTLRSVGNIIDGLVQIRHHEPHIFKLAFERLDDLFYQHEEAALQTDGNLRALERREAEQFAGGQADREIALRLQDAVLPAAISTFILTAWREVLVHNYLYGGPKGKSWQLGLATLEDIVKSLRPSTDASERRRLIKVIPAYIEFLLNVPDATDDQDVLAANFFAELHRAHELALAGKWAEIGGERFMPASAALAVSPTVASPSAMLASLGLACGDWIETRDFSGVRRWRLNWITSILGTCIFKHYETNSTRHMSCEELHDRLSSGEAQRVRGLGLADDVLNDAFETVSHQTRREQANVAMRTPGAAHRDALSLDMAHQWGSAAPVSPPARSLQ